MDQSKYTLEFERPLRDLEKQLDALRNASKVHNLDVSSEVAAIERKIETTEREIYTNLTAWQKVQIARHPQRPCSLDHIDYLFTDFQELHGDREFGDDHALIGGTAFFEGKPVMVVAQQKGRNTKENLRRHFGMPHPEGYRKALRLMKLADRFSLPILAFIDTPGAYPGVASEQRNVAHAIAVNLYEMSTFKVPIIATIIGEGGSGGALGIGVADRILIFEYAYYSVITPESCSAILWRSKAYAAQAAEALRLHAQELLKHRVADEIVDEPFGGAHHDPEISTERLKLALSRHLKILRSIPSSDLIVQRCQKYRSIGEFEDLAAQAVAG